LFFSVFGIAAQSDVIDVDAIKDSQNLLSTSRLQIQILASYLTNIVVGHGVSNSQIGIINISGSDSFKIFSSFYFGKLSLPNCTSAIRKAKAEIVSEGFTPIGVGIIDPSIT
jgi:hypothetical protein